MLSVEKRGSSSHPARADIGVYGLGVMGAALARNLARKGYTVAVTNIDSSVTQQFLADFGDEGDFIEATAVEDFAAELKTPRVAMLMVTAGQAVDSVSASLAAYFSPGDVIVDMGNSHFGDTCRRQEHFAHAGLHFVGCGTSGGQQGALLGPALMVGGSAHAYARLGAMFESIAAKADDGAPCCAHVGENGAGHFVKTLHNGIEYADMQLISEAYALLRSGLGMSAPSIGEIFAEWNQGELNSYLTEITADILIREDSPGVPLVDVIDDAAGQKGTGLWTAQIALELGVPASILIEAVQARVLSAVPYRSRNAQRNIMGGDTDSQRWSENSSGTVGDFEEMIEHVRRALYLGKIASYSQGFSIIDAGSLEYGWDINKAQVALNWRAGCIIRAELLEKISDAFSQEPELDLLLASPLFRGVIDEYLSSLRIVTELAVSAGVPAPALYATLSYLDSLRSDRLPTALIQAQRDCFGSHGFKRVDKDGVFHEEW
ncbi:NADP-dependent phosphogluconate dehydrogenase [Arcanobacterium bovis]|nr:NADP-dependent phosphogluconate dehydrogenase [Arcanobacterium bovis]